LFVFGLPIRIEIERQFNMGNNIGKAYMGCGIKQRLFERDFNVSSAAPFQQVELIAIKAVTTATNIRTRSLLIALRKEHLNKLLFLSEA